MNTKIDLVFRFDVKIYYLRDNEFVPDNPEDECFLIEKTYLDDRVYKLKDRNCYILTDKTRTIWWFVDKDRQHFSGCRNSVGDIYERGGALADRNIMSLCYRTSKTGSTSVYNSFRLDVVNDEYDGDGWPWCSEIWLTKQRLNNIDLNNWFKFIIFRDPLDRFFSQFNFIFRFYKWTYPPQIKKSFMVDKDIFKKYIITVMTVNNFFNCRDEFHISHQKILIDNCYKDAPIDCVCMLPDIEKFFNDKLKIKFSYRVVGHIINDKISMDDFTNDELCDIRSALSMDFDLFEFNKDKVYYE